MFPFPFSFLGSSISAEFNYSASAYCQDASDPTPTITGTSGGTFTAAEPFKSLKLKVTTTSANQSFIYIAGTGSNYHIDWDDGNGFVGPYTTAQTKTYTNAGSYIVQVGQYNDTVNVAYGFGNFSSTNLIEEIQQWPEGLNTNLLNFQHRTNSTALEITATNIPEFSAGTNLQKCFANISAIVDNGDNLSKWNLDNVTNMSYFFDSSSIPSALDTNTKQVTYNGSTYIAWDVKSLTNGAIGRGNMPIGTNWNINSMTSLKSLSAGKNNTDLERKQITVGTGTTQRIYNQWDSENVTQYQTSSNEHPNMILDDGFNNYSIKNWIFNYTLSNSSSYLFFSYQAAWGANSSNDNYTNCWIGWAIGIKNGWVSEKGSNYTADYLTNFSINMHSSFSSKMNSSLSIDSNIHSNIPTGWITAADALDYLTNTQGWTIPYT